MIRWPIRAARAVSKLFKSTQNVDIFVEDQGDEQFYTKLFQIVAPEGTVVTRVVALGGRGPVVEAARSYQDERLALFLIDGDLEWVRGEAAPSVPRLYRLECYCVENLLLNESLVVAVGAEEMMCGANDAKARLEYSDWLTSVQCLVPLFARFAVLNRIAPELATVGDGFAGLVEADPRYKLPRLCPQKVRSRIIQVEDLIASKIGARSTAEIERVEQRIAALDNQLLSVSGKSLLLPLLFFHLKTTSKTRVSFEQFRFRLGSKCSSAELLELRQALEVAA